MRHAVLTALAQEADITAGFAAEADDYIVKPFSLRDLAMRVNAVLRLPPVTRLPDAMVLHLHFAGRL